MACFDPVNALEVSRQPDIFTGYNTEPYRWLNISHIGATLVQCWYNGYCSAGTGLLWQIKTWHSRRVYGNIACLKWKLRCSLYIQTLSRSRITVRPKPWNLCCPAQPVSHQNVESKITTPSPTRACTTMCNMPRSKIHCAVSMNNKDITR